MWILCRVDDPVTTLVPYSPVRWQSKTSPSQPGPLYRNFLRSYCGLGNRAVDCRRILVLDIIPAINVLWDFGKNQEAPDVCVCVCVCVICVNFRKSYGFYADGPGVLPTQILCSIFCFQFLQNISFGDTVLQLQTVTNKQKA